MRVIVSKSRGWGEIPAPRSKSYAHRLMIGAALSGGGSSVTDVTPCEDLLATMDCIAALNIPYTFENGVFTVTGGMLPVAAPPTFPCRESGSTLRFFLPIAAALCGSGRFIGSERLLERGVGIYEELFRAKGVLLQSEQGALTLSGKLPAGEYTLCGNVSSQFVTGLLFALSAIRGESLIRVLPPVESRPYIDMTLQVLQRYGIAVRETEPNCFAVCGGEFCPAHTATEGDWSNSAALLALNVFGGMINLTGLDSRSLQGDRICRSLFAMTGQTHTPIDISACPDLGPILFAVAAAMGGGVFTGTARLSIKESDRAAVMAEELQKCGARVQVGDNRVRIEKSPLHPPPCPLDGHNDHRVVMALTVLLTLFGGEIVGAQAVRKSYPDFFEDMRRLHIEVREVADET